MKVWITKHALSDGIEEVEVEQSKHAESMVSWSTGNGSWTSYAHGEGKNWHRTKESAVARAEIMRLRKITSHRNAINKLEKLKFTL